MQFINNFRGIAILLVIFVHTIVTMGTSDSIFLYLLSEPLRNCTILFVVVAGYLFSFQLKDFNYKRFIISKMKTVVVPYIVISIPAVLIYVLNLKSTHFWIDMDWFSKLNPVYQYIYLMITGAHLGPLWFIPMIILFYLISPIFIFIKNKNLLPLFFILSLLPALYLGREASHASVILASLYFLPAYLFGLILASNNKIYEKLKNYSTSALIIYIICYWILSYNFEVSTAVDLPLKLLLSVIVLSFCSRFLNKKNKILDMFARLSFFLFFVHGYFVAALKMVSSKVDFQSLGILSPFLAFIFVIFMSLAVFVLIKLIFHDNSKKWVGI